jgi:glycine/D-amino acid oxidase-like deaminating enzyme
MWRTQPPYAEVANWGGSIVASADAEGHSAGGAYAVRSQLSRDELARLEPMLVLPTEEPPTETHYHSYPDEGHVCPCAATSTLQARAQAAGATFVWSSTVDGLVRECELAKGVTVSCGGAEQQQCTTTKIDADAVVLAAGVGIGSHALGAAVPMLHSPGRLAHTAVAAADAPPMRALFVDARGGSHVLQRPDGRFVVGGELSGYGKVEEAHDATAAEGASSDSEALLRRAREWLPSMDAPLQGTTYAARVVPKDGLPAVGWSAKAGAYVVAAHSAITLAPLLAALVAIELADGMEAALLEPWRPERF